MSTGETKFMSVAPDIQTRCDLAIDALKESEVQPITKSSLTQALLASAKCTNGYPTEQKIQAMSESIFGLVEIMSIHYISDTELKSDFKSMLGKALTTPTDPANTKTGMIVQLIRDCKRELLIFGIAVCALLAYQPQLASLIESLSNKPRPQIIQVQPTADNNH